jgi:hypothetical protein
MSRPCTVCTHVRRAEIDWRLAFAVINLTKIAREYGVSRDALRSHREHHLPACLAAFQASADALTLNERQAEAGQLYMNALVALAHAERGALVAVANDGQPAPTVSMTAIASKIREARASLDQLARLASDATAHAERPQEIADAELGARIRTEEARLANRPARPHPANGQ